MSSEGFINDYRLSLDREISIVIDRLSKGAAKDYAEYLSMVREIRAYNRAKSNFAEELGKYFKDEDEVDNSEEDPDD